MMAYQECNAVGAVTLAAQKRPNEKTLHSDLSADGFDIWWKKTFAQHAAVVAQASTLMRAYRRVSSDGETRIGQAR
jgi:hypothetical protein